MELDINATFFTVGSLHDHVINYKVDLDVVGTSNSLLATRTAQEETTHPWLEDDWGTTVIQQKITREYIENEDDALLKLPLNFQGGYAIVNKEEKNAWDIPRGYAIHPGYSPIHNVSLPSIHLRFFASSPMAVYTASDMIVASSRPSWARSVCSTTQTGRGTTSRCRGARTPSRRRAACGT